jgi:ABC-type glycerol-3-phosphate transport system substrate-binding protein
MAVHALRRGSVSRLVLAAALCAAVGGGFGSCGLRDNYGAKYAGWDFGSEKPARPDSYTAYHAARRDVPPARTPVPVNLFAWSAGTGLSAVNVGGVRALRTEETGWVEWKVTVPADALYTARIEYYPVPARGIAIERSFAINGKVPFLGADRLSFQRVWGDAPGKIRTDNQGNQIRPSQVEKPDWQSAYFNDYLGYVSEPYEFYLHKGVNTIRLTGVDEPLVLRSFTLDAQAKRVPYRDYIAGIDTSRYASRAANVYLTKIQGENAPLRSDPSLYANFDGSSATTEPSAVGKITLNMIGGQGWGIADQWIEWDFNVPADGMYRISIKARQNYNRGFIASRSFAVDGKVPCDEMAAVPFRYSDDWKLVTPKDVRGDDIYLPLKTGSHTLRLTVTMGRLGDMLNTMEDSVFALNGIYRRILVLTGPEPDPFRDYRVEAVYPDVITEMRNQYHILYKLADDLTAYTGERGAQTASVLTLARQLEMLCGRPDKIPLTLQNFKSNISSLGDSLNALSASQLDIDYILVSGKDARLPDVHESFPEMVGHGLHAFLASFFIDYNNLGNVYRGKSKVVDVWLLSGRDQSTILKTMIDDTFTPQSGIGVNLRLVTADAVMPAVVAGNGPDAALTMGSADPVNYALRGAVLDLSKFEGFPAVVKNFQPSLMVGLTWNGGVWALPETQYFQVMFYRTDILQELGVKPPNTWDDLINILPIIQRASMNIGYPSVASTQDFSAFLAQLYQRHGTLYTADGSRTNLDTGVGIQAFDAYTRFFMDYKTPETYDFVNRFRTGDMPLGFADLTTFNTLEVFAPEIRGLWDFGLMPGIKQPDGTIDRSVSTGTTVSMIFSNAKQPEQAWEFLKWWLSTPTQTRYSHELESVMGAAGRNPTSNLAAFERLSWGSHEMKILEEQRKWTVGTPEVPGGYYASRNIVNAVRKVLNDGEDARETLLDYSTTINDELRKKRIEFGLEKHNGLE